MALATLLFGVNVPFGDDWSLIRIVAKTYSGTLPLSELWAPYNGHRMFFSRPYSAAYAAGLWDIRNRAAAQRQALRTLADVDAAPDSVLQAGLLDDPRNIRIQVKILQSLHIGPYRA